MPKGRPPLPTALHLVRNTKSRVKNEDGFKEVELDPLMQLPAHPKTLFMEIAQREWTNRGEYLIRSKVLQETDLLALESYCISFQMMCMAMEDIENQGTTVAGAMGGPVKNPACSVLKDAQTELRQMGNLLGLNPSARTRINVGTQSKDKPQGLGDLRKPFRSK